jgi:ATP-dependent RNA helicase SUPV3L1/SUV3
VQERLDSWLAELIGERLKPLVEISAAEDLTGLARGIAFRMTECFGALKRETVAQEMKSLDQAARAQLRKYGVRFGAFNIYFPLLLKPAAAELTLVLWVLKHGQAHAMTLDRLPELPRPGLTSFAADAELPEPFYRAFGFHVCGPRAVRIDILERLADLIRTLLAWRPGAEGASAAPRGSTGDGGFAVTPEMMSILGCSAEELSHVLRTLGFNLERRPVQKVEAPAAPSAPAVSEAPALEAGLPPSSDTAPAATDAAPTVPAPDPAASPEQQPATSAAPSGDGSQEGPLPEQQFEEIWRPKRRREHGRAEERHKSRQRFRRPDGDSRPGEPQPHDRTATDPAKSRRPKRRPRRDDRAGSMPPRREEPRPVAARTGSPAAQKRGGVDPDSPFAALGALKLALEKRAQDPKTS